MIPSAKSKSDPSGPFRTLQQPSADPYFVLASRIKFDLETEVPFSPSAAFRRKANHFDYSEPLNPLKGILIIYKNSDNRGVYTYYRSLPHLDPSVLHFDDLGHPATAYNRFGGRALVR